MRRGIGGVIVAGLVVMSLGAQDRALEPRAFAEVVRFETSLRELETAVNDPDLTAALIGRVLVFDGERLGGGHPARFLCRNRTRIRYLDR